MHVASCPPVLELRGQPSERLAQRFRDLTLSLRTQLAAAPTLEALLAHLGGGFEGYLGSLLLEGRALVAAGFLTPQELDRATPARIAGRLADAVDGLATAYERGWLGNIPPRTEEK